MENSVKKTAINNLLINNKKFGKEKLNEEIPLQEVGGR